MVRYVVTPSNSVNRYLHNIYLIDIYKHSVILSIPIKKIMRHISVF